MKTSDTCSQSERGKKGSANHFLFHPVTLKVVKNCQTGINMYNMNMYTGTEDILFHTLGFDWKRTYYYRDIQL